jgi:hypothetical protein
LKGKIVRIGSISDLDRLKRDQKLSPRVAAQLEAELNKLPKTAKRATAKGASAGLKGATSKAVNKSAGESKGEASVRLALIGRFGDFLEGGEVVQELIPFEGRRFRADFALPRYSISVEVEGWSHHGAFLNDHHKDRERSMYFARHNWLTFQLSHGQALKQTAELIDGIEQAMLLRVAEPRDAICLFPVPHKNGTWYKLVTPGHAE